MKIHRSNLESALEVAIEEQSDRECCETDNPAFKSGLVAGWEDLLEAVRRGEHIEFFDT